MKLFQIALLFTLGAGQAFGASDAASVVTAMTTSATGITLQTDQGTLILEPWTNRIIHVVAFHNPDWKGAYNPAVIGKPHQVAWTVAETSEAYTLSTPALQVRVDRATAALSFRDPSGKIILDEPAHARSTPVSSDGPQAVRQDFAGSGAYFGLGQHPNGLMNYAGNIIHLQQANRDVAVPMLVSQSGYGILWNDAAVTDVDVGTASDPAGLTFRSEAGGGIDYDFIYGPTLDDVVAGYRDLTGDAPMMARWTWGLFQSKEHYATQQELLAVAAKYRALHAPLDAVVQDWQYWQAGQWGSHVMNPARYPDPAGMMQTLHGEHVHAIISVWPRFDLGTANLAELDKAGGMLAPVYPNVYPKGEGRWYDPFSAAGRDIYWRQIMRTLGRDGFDGWWLDASEAELGGQWGQMRDITTAAGPGAVVYNAYPLMHTTAVHDGMRRDIPGKRVFILTRSAYAGQQRNGAITWSGDTSGSWDNFRRQIPEGLNFSLSGIPYWSNDIGGFFGGDPKDPAYAELFTRWYEYGVFNPMFRVHGTGDSKELWQFEPDIQQILLRYDQLRYRLLPYIYSLSWDVTHNRGTMMRPLVMDFQDDPQVADITNQYMFGKALLVNPVTQKGAAVRTVYLPGKTPWYDFWTGTRFGAGQVIAAKADLGTIPVYVRAGSVLPLGPVVQYANEETDKPTELRVYPGADGQFLLYDDAGDGYGYQKGQYATVRLSWNDAEHRLIIGRRQGSYPGMAKSRRFEVTCGFTSTQKPQAVSYTGGERSVLLPDCR
ncbi:MAG: glycoside hydrolase family 31 protein [Alphaproteobacteria bacterium]|nr:glycoside hydrolase family 31 protein [Alphaproteobacteria bacterium]